METSCRGDKLERLFIEIGRGKVRTRGDKMEEMSQKTFAASSWSLVSDPVSRYCPRALTRVVPCTVFISERQSVPMLYLASSSSKETPIIHANGFKRFEFVEVAGRTGSKTDGKRATGPRCSKMGRGQTMISFGVTWSRGVFGTVEKRVSCVGDF